MSSNALRRLTDKKGNQLSKFLGIDSVPSTRLIATMQSRINNPIFRLSMTDYEAMCGNNIMVKMMSKVIGCEEKQLKKFCKYINVFAENIKTSPKSIKNKMKVSNSINASNRKGSLSVLPDDILEKIVEQYKTIFKIKYKLKDWIPPEKLNWVFLSENPNAIELLKANRKKIDWDYLSLNPNAIELLKANPDKINWLYLSQNTNPKAIELLKTFPNVIESLNANPDFQEWEALSSNPSAIELLQTYPENINWPYLSLNPKAIELLEANLNKIDWDNLSMNPNAIELLKANPEKIDWNNLSANPNPKAIELLKANKNNINWHLLSANPNAIELLEANKGKINWHSISRNPVIFDEILE